MKILLLLLVIGCFEIYLVGSLHEIFGTRDLVVVYIATTAFGALIAWLNLSQFKRAKSQADFANKFRKRWQEGSLSKSDINKLTYAFYCMAYILGCILIGLPGVTTDILGFLLVLSPVSSAVGKYMAKSAVKFQPDE
jgi:UPF0716 family protein affecting phage T7 exclusion